MGCCQSNESGDVDAEKTYLPGSAVVSEDTADEVVVFTDKSDEAVDEVPDSEPLNGQGGAGIQESAEDLVKLQEQLKACEQQAQELKVASDDDVVQGQKKDECILLTIEKNKINRSGEQITFDRSQCIVPRDKVLNECGLIDICKLKKMFDTDKFDRQVFVQDLGKGSPAAAAADKFLHPRLSPIYEEPNAPRTTPKEPNVEEQ